jgi:hypothetical protein
MASKYVPPHIRNKPAQETSAPVRVNRRYASKYQPEPEPVKEPEPKLDFSDKSFPQLGCSVTTEPKWAGKKSFASLATEWKEADETAQVSSQTETYTEFRLPRFTNVRHYVEVEEERFSEEEETRPAPAEAEAEDDGWEEVKAKTRKVHREKTIEERIAEEEAAEQEKAGTCWNEDGDEPTTVWG